jgi:uncharacterized protein YggU (UPF0235/DUF167 family)
VPLITVTVKTGSRVSALAPGPDGGFVARVRAQPIDGKANDELIALVARHYRCRKAAVTIKAGASSRTKLILILTA